MWCVCAKCGTVFLTEYNFLFCPNCFFNRIFILIKTGG